MRNGRKCADPVAFRWLKTSVLVVAACVFGFAPAQATHSYWTVVAVEGTAAVSFRKAANHAATRGQAVGPGTTIRTGKDGTVMLERHGSSIVVYPGSELTVPGTADGDHRGIVQRSGESLYRIKAGEAVNFEVRTPYLSATVEGTVFIVTVTADRATVSVATGRVRVVPARAARGDIVRAGNRASVVAASADQVMVDRVDLGDTTMWHSGRLLGAPASDELGNVGSPVDNPGASGSRPDNPGTDESTGDTPGHNGSGGGNPNGGGPQGRDPGEKGSGGGNSNGNGPGGDNHRDSGSRGGDSPGHSR